MKVRNLPQCIALLITSLLFLSSCGGGGLTVADGGITGTGITAGRVTNFGSIFINGIKFDVDNAMFFRDGENSTGQSEYLVGEYIVIEGNVNADGLSGKATKVTFIDSLEGEVTQTSSDGITIEVLGQVIKFDPLIVFHGFNIFTDLQVGNVVEVSGIKDSSGVVNATSIQLKQTIFVNGSSENEIKGFITQVDSINQTLQIGNLTVDFSSAELKDFNGSTPQIGQFVEAKSNQALIGALFTAFKIELEDENITLGNNTEVEIEGLVNDFTSITQFEINGIPVITTSETVYKDGLATEVALNVLLEIKGKINTSGVLVAEEIEFEDNSSGSGNNSEIRVENIIQSIDLQNSEITVDGTVFVIDTSTLMIDKSQQKISPLTIDDLGVGDQVKLRGSSLSNDKVQTSRLERKD
jgi:hypothetical protein